MFLNKHLFRSAKFISLLICLFVLNFIYAYNTAHNTHAATYEATINTSGNISLDVSAAGNGATVTTDTLNIISTCPEGYEVLIQGPADATLYKDGDKTNTVATKKINASAGTKDTPRGILGVDSATDTSNINTWGYSAASDTTIRSTSFIGLNNNLNSLYTKNSASATGGDSLPIYYGVSVDHTIETGTYTMAESTTGAGDNKITYSLVTNINCMTYQVAFNPTSTTGGINVSGTGTMTNQRIYEDIATELSANSFVAPDGYTFIGWNTAQDGTGVSYTDEQSITNIATTGNTITLYAQWRSSCPAHTICYNDNGANSPTTMGNQSVDSSATEVTLWAYNFRRPGYGFAGWSTYPDILACGLAEVPMTGELICLIPDNSMFGPNETIAITDQNTYLETGTLYIKNGITLYAIWVEPAKDANGNALSFQTPNLLTTTLDNGFALTDLPTGYVTALKDERDNQVYAVAKLADGNYWMIENLRLDSTAELTTTNTNNPLNNAGTVTIKNSDGNTTNHLSTSTDPTTTAWCNNTNATCYDQSMIFTGNTASSATQMTSNNANTYSYGNYYNWYSATAGNAYSYSTNNNSVNGSICPAGWRLPKGGNKTRIEANDDNEFWNLAVNGLNNGTLPANYSSSTYPYYTGAEATGLSNALRSFPNNFAYSGYVYGSSIDNRGADGYYWSSTAYDSLSAYSLRFRSSYVYPGTNHGGKNNGAMARCVLGS